MDQRSDAIALDNRDDLQEVMLASLGGRRFGVAVAIALVIGLAGFGLLIAPWLQSAFGPLPSSSSFSRIKAGFTLLALIVTALAAALATTGWRIARSQQSPPPGALLWRDTRIVRGARARRTGIAYCATGVLCGALGIGLGVTIWILLERVAESSTITLPPGVTILRQTSTEGR